MTARDDIYFGGEKTKKGDALFPGSHAERERPRPGEAHPSRRRDVRETLTTRVATHRQSRQKQKTNSTPRKVSDVEKHNSKGRAAREKGRPLAMHRVTSSAVATITIGQPATHHPLADSFVRLFVRKLRGRGGKDGEGAGVDDADDGRAASFRSPSYLSPSVLNSSGSRWGSTLVVRLAVAEAEFVDVAGLAIAADERRGKKTRLKVSERRSRGGRNGDRIGCAAPRSRDDRGSRPARRATGTRPRETVERESSRPRTCEPRVCGGPGHPRFAGKTEFERRGAVKSEGDGRDAGIARDRERCWVFPAGAIGSAGAGTHVLGAEPDSVEPL